MKTRTRERVYFREAVVTLTLARILLRLVPRTRIFAWANKPPAPTCRFADREIAWISWAIAIVSSRPWFKTTGIARALATQAMLRRRGVDGKLCLGVASINGATLTHAWVEVRRSAVPADPELNNFVKLAEFGGNERFEEKSSRSGMIGVRDEWHRRPNSI
jgi:hypothetical protein